MTVMIVGSTGQLGQELVHLMQERQVDFVAYSSSDLDITNRTLVLERVAMIKPSVIFDAAAYTRVDAAEEGDGKDLNWQVNEQGTKNLVDAAKNTNAILVFVSTDYVFDGKKTKPYLETDDVNPQNEYGKAKAAAEEFIINAGIKYYIVRTSWVFGQYGNNFVYTMERLAKEHAKLKVVADQEGRPTWAKTLAEFMNYLRVQNAEYGIYNLSNAGQTTWFEFAREILKDTQVEIIPVTSDEFPTIASRPAYSVLSLEKSQATGFIIPSWQDALQEFKKSIKSTNGQD